MNSDLLDEDPRIEFVDNKALIHIRGFDAENVFYKTTLVFSSVLGFEMRDPYFAREFYDSFDTVVEVFDSTRLEEYQKNNPKEFAFWRPRHFVLLLIGFGMFHIIAKTIEVREND